MITNTELEFKGDLYPSKIVSFEHDVDSVFFNTDNSVVLKITVLRDSMIRFRYTTKGYFSNDFSYAIDKSHTHGYNFLEVTEAADYYQIQTSKVICKVQKIDMRVSIFDLSGNVLLEDELGFHWEESYEFGGNIVKMSKASKEGESFLHADAKMPAFQRMESILLNAFDGQPGMVLPKQKDPNRVFELRSYESPTPHLADKKRAMFNHDEMKIFSRLKFNPVFYSEVISGSHMPNLMYMPIFKSVEDRNAQWKIFGNDAKWKEISADPVNENNVSVSHIDSTLMHSTNYSDY